MIVVSPVGGWLADTCGRRLPVAGLALVSLGTVPMAVAGTEILLPLLVVGLAFVGMGIGVARTWSAEHCTVESVAQAEAGVASGIYSTSRYLGYIGSAVLALGSWAVAAGSERPWPRYS